MRQKFRIIPYPNDKNRIIIPAQYYHHFKHIAMIQHGLQSLSCDILSHRKDIDTIYLSSSIMKQLHLTNDIPVIFNTNSRTCYIHYPFGVFIHRPPSQNTYEQLFQEMARVGQQVGFETIFFSYQDVYPKTNSVTGFVWQEQQWQTTKTDIPPFIYNRLPNRKIESHKTIKKIKQYLATNSIIFNPDFFNKWQVYDDLRNHDKVNYLLPDTIFHPSIQTIQDKLSQQPISLLSLKDDVTDHIYIEQVGDLIFVTSNYMNHEYYQSLEELKQTRFPNGFQQYVLQEALDLIQHQGDPFYFRVHMTKLEQWQISFFYGKKNTVNDWLDTERLDIGNNSLKKVKDLAFVLSNIVENIIPGTIGEIGFDIGMDREQRLWLLEVHAKPSWQVLYHPPFAAKTREYFTTLFQFPLASVVDSE
ncbi:YheC/YheD family protein [Gracilibacillus sp. HCP3S3_G5_1]|uniref:YheC/YheD family protein n=1 Tax=unclassified Gracilibacillus TaxID=2625209 RepID=UPI003F8BF231